MALMERLNDWSAAASASEVSAELRRGETTDLRRRRVMAGLSLVAIGSMGVISLYQLGLIRHLPEPPLPGLDADRVDAADDAYRRLRLADSVIGLNSYGTTLALTAMGGADRNRERPWIAVALAAKAVLDAAQAGKLTWDQWSKHRAFCSYCLVAAGATFAVLPLALAGARDALENL